VNSNKLQEQDLM